MNDSILLTIKKLLGLTEDYDHFDPDIIMHINSVFLVLNQLGVGPKDIFFITDDSAVWSDFLQDENQRVPLQSYVYLKVKVLFDPPGTSFVLESMNKLISEFEWRLNVACDNPTSSEEM